MIWIIGLIVFLVKFIVDLFASGFSLFNAIPGISWIVGAWYLYPIGFLLLVYGLTRNIKYAIPITIALLVGMYFGGLIIW